MARTLETLDLGTPVFVGEVRVGDVRGLYAEGAARSVEWLVVDWESRGEVAVPAVPQLPLTVLGPLHATSAKPLYSI